MGDFTEDAVALARAWDEARPRSQQTEPGWSNMSDCRAETGFRIRGDWPTDQPDNWPAEVGTAMHEWWTEVRRHDCLAQGIPASFGVPVTYRGVPGRLDEVLWPVTPGGRFTVTDWKFPGLASARMRADEAFLGELFIQPNGYASGLLSAEYRYVTELGGTHAVHDQFTTGPLDPDSCTVRLLDMPVGSGATFTDWQGYERPYSKEAADAAVDRYQDVIAADAAGEELPRDKPFWWCTRFCSWFSLCRGFDAREPRDLEEITDPELRAAVNAYGIAGEIIGANKKIQRELRPLIEDARGVTPDGWRVFHARGNPGKMEYDDNAVEAILGSRGIPVSEVMRPGPPGSPKLTVSRVKAK